MKLQIRLFIILLAPVLWFASCTSKSNKDEEREEVNIYTHRHYDVDQKLFADFEKSTGIRVNVVNASADELIEKMQMEGEQSPADVLITVDAGRLHRAKERDLLQSFSTPKLEENIPSKFRDPEGYWYGLTYRARIIVYAKERVNPEELSTYEALTDNKWAGRVLIRSSSNIYNQSLMASIIEAHGSDSAYQWAVKMVENFARDPKGSDRDQVKAIAAGIGDVAIVNSYYIGKMLDSKIEEEVKAGNSVTVFFPNQNDRGTHINVSGAGISKYAPNKENAIKFIEFLSDNEAQAVFAGSNFEYPVKPGIEFADLLKSWGEFKSDDINLSVLGKNNQKAVILFDKAGWK